MSPPVLMPSHAVWSFPRVSGDEPPAPEAGKPAAVFSPRERG